MKRPRYPKYISYRPLPKRLRGRVFSVLTKVKTACPGAGAGEPATHVCEAAPCYSPPPVRVRLTHTHPTNCYYEPAYVSIEDWDAYDDCAEPREARAFRDEVAELGDESQRWQVWAYERGNAAIARPTIESLFGTHARIGDKLTKEYLK